MTRWMTLRAAAELEVPNARRWLRRRYVAAYMRECARRGRLGRSVRLRRGRWEITAAGIARYRTVTMRVLDAALKNIFSKSIHDDLMADTALMSLFKPLTKGQVRRFTERTVSIRL